MSQLKNKMILKILNSQLAEAQKNADRYEKLRKWMSSNVQEGWNEVERLGAIAAYVCWDEFDAYLDSLPECNVGLCYKRPTVH